jgi:hypothetical protein
MQKYGGASANPAAGPRESGSGGRRKSSGGVSGGEVVFASRRGCAGAFTPVGGAAQGARVVWGRSRWQGRP